MKKILLVGVEPRSLINFRGSLIHSIEEKDCVVVAVSSPAPENILKAFNEQNIKHQAVCFQRSGMNPFNDLITLLNLCKLFKREKPDFILCYTIKPVIFGGLAARLTGTKFYALVTGLGFAFQGKSFKRIMLTNLVSYLYRISLSYATKVVFQNTDNRDLFTSRLIVRESKTEVVNGSGVDICHFGLSVLPALDNGVTFLCISRLLGEKGLREYAQAAALVKAKFPSSKFVLVGPEDTSPDGILNSEVDLWQAIHYEGPTTDVRPFIKKAHVYVLPSYHEGLPRSTIEAMAMGRPVITTNAVGCKETVVDGVNGFKVVVGDAAGLAEKMIWFIEHSEQTEPMGFASRKMVEEKFDVNKVNDRMLDIMELV